MIISNKLKHNIQAQYIFCPVKVENSKKLILYDILERHYPHNKFYIKNSTVEF